MQDLDRAKTLLQAEGYTCVLCMGDRIHTSHRRGVAPLMELLDQRTDVRGFSAADKVVGKATALLYRLLGVRAVYAAVISQAALEVLSEGNIDTSYGTLVDHIINRTGDGPCPMEAATKDISDPTDAPAAIRQKLRELQSK
jgi:hypothetical protein